MFVRGGGFTCSVAFVLAGKAYYNCNDGFFEFDPNASDQMIRQINRNSEFTNFDFGDIVYIPLEELNVVYAVLKNFIWKFDPSKGPVDPFNKPLGEWTPVGPVKFPDSWNRVTVYESFSSNGMMYIGFATISTIKHLREFWQFNPLADPNTQWKRMPDFTGNYKQRGAYFSIGNKIYLGVGIAGRPTIDYDPVTEVTPFTGEFWEFTPPL